MTGVLSVRLPASLESTVRLHAARAQAPSSHVVSWVLRHAIDGRFNFMALKDPAPSLDAKLDIRMSEDLISAVRNESDRMKVLVSVYIRTILYAFYTRRLIFLKEGEHYTLVANDDQTKSS